MNTWTEDTLVPKDGVYSSAYTREIMYGLTVRYPFIEMESVGKSVMGRDIFMLKMGEGEKAVFYSGAFHANEWLTTPLLLIFAEQYAKAVMEGVLYEKTDVRRLMKQVTLYMIPQVNPDGVDLVTGMLRRGTYYEKAKAIGQRFPQIPFPEGWKANIEGVDLNLQFPAGWELAKKLKCEKGFNRPSPRDYTGEAPLSAPEARAVYDFTLGHDFALILAYHTQGQVIYWKYRDCEPENARKIGEYFERASGYKLEPAPAFSANAGYKDWFLQTYDRPGYTVEAGLGTSPLPVENLEEIYMRNKGILMGAMTQVS